MRIFKHPRTLKPSAFIPSFVMPRATHEIRTRNLGPQVIPSEPCWYDNEHSKYNKLLWKLNHNSNTKDGEYSYSITEIFEKIVFTTKEIFTQY